MPKHVEEIENQIGLGVKMHFRFRSGRRLHAYLKWGTCILVGVCYFAFLFRESLNAFEHRERATAAELEASELLAEPSKQQLKLKRQQLQRQRLLEQQQQHRVASAANGSALAETTATPASTLNPVYEYSEELHSRTERDLRLRREHLATVCEHYKLQEKYPPNPWEFFISPGHNNLVWCNVFKAASSTWMYYFNILGESGWHGWVWGWGCCNWQQFSIPNNINGVTTFICVHHISGKYRKKGEITRTV